jgi:hypothetical protein
VKLSTELTGAASKLAPEDELLLACSRITLSDSAKRCAAELMQQYPDWDYVLESSIAHAVAPLFYNGLRQVSTAAVPEPVLSELHRIYRNNALRNDRLYRNVETLFLAFQREKIEAVGLKDLQLAWEIYPEPALRPMGDIDILIRREDYERVAVVLSGLDFAPEKPELSMIRKYGWAHHFRREEDESWLDIQWNVCQREWDTFNEQGRNFDIETMWRRAREMRVHTAYVLVPSPEDMLFHLCLHLEGHKYSELVLVCDIAELVRHYSEFDWETVVSLARRHGAESSIENALLLVQRLLDAPVPEWVLEQLAGHYVKANVLEPLFGNLTELHVSVDEIASDVAPPRELVEEFEGTVRFQAVAAREAFTALNAVCSTFEAEGSNVLFGTGEPSERIFPDQHLRAFGGLNLFIVEDDWPRMCSALEQCGFLHTPSPEKDGIYKLQFQPQTNESICKRGVQPLNLQLRIDGDHAQLVSALTASNPSKKDIALRSMKNNLLGCDNHTTMVPVTINLFALHPEALVVYTAALTGKQRRHPLFAAMIGVNFLRRYKDPIDWSKVQHLAKALDLQAEVSQGLLILSRLSEEVSSSVDREALARAPRLFSSARYDAAFSRYTELKGMFFFLFTLLSLRTNRQRGKFLFSAIKPGGKLRSLSSEFLKAVRRMLRGGSCTVRDLAYWLRPEQSAVGETR